MRVVTLVPMRAGVPERDRLWEFARQWWANDHPDWPIYEGNHDEGPFNRSAAINTAAALAGEWEVAVIIDADIIANPESVRAAVDKAVETGCMVLPHDRRYMLNAQTTEAILNGYRGPWDTPDRYENLYTDSVSCVVVVPRDLWELVGGFDEQFVGWGYEDTGFYHAVQTIGQRGVYRLDSQLFHLWHPLQPEATSTAPTLAINKSRRDAYYATRDDPAAMLRLAVPAGELGATRIPRILHRTVPAETTEQVEAWWGVFGVIHSGWDLRTHRDPLDPADWPLTSDLWSRCANGAQLAGLIRLEVLVTHGGVYVDSDVEPVRSFEPLLHLPAFAGWEDETTVPDAVMAAEPGHPAFVEMLRRARVAVEQNQDAYGSGPAISTAVLPERVDVLCLPPGAFYPFHYLHKSGRDDDAGPWVYCRHHWHHSWGTPAQRESIAARQR